MLRYAFDPLYASIWLLMFIRPCNEPAITVGASAANLAARSVPRSLGGKLKAPRPYVARRFGAGRCPIAK